MVHLEAHNLNSGCVFLEVLVARWAVNSEGHCVFPPVVSLCVISGFVRRVSGFDMCYHQES